MQTFKEALGLDFNQKTAKEHLENLEQQVKLMEQVSHLFWVRSASSNYLHVSQILSFSPDDNSAFNLNQTFLEGEKPITSIWAQRLLSYLYFSKFIKP